jgi:hypothetical protein
MVENDSENIQETASVENGETVTRASNLPLAVTISALLVYFAFQTFQLVRERSMLSELKVNLETPLQESQKVRSQLEALLTKTAELANQGNPAAKTVVEELQKRGVPIGAESQPPKQP